jgi:NTP pyrophosphatase (non-canonical NTP hydrolase)
MVEGWEATYTQFTRDTAQYPSDVEMEYLMIGLANEVGEVLGKYKKHLRGDTMVLQDFRDGLIDELGDVMWYFARICDTLDIKMYEVMERNVKKLTRRLNEGTIKGEGDTR